MPFSTADLNAYIAQPNLGRATADYLRGAAAGPSRDVGTTGYRSVAAEFPSRKMGTSIATESRRGELAYVLLSEYVMSSPTTSNHPDFLVFRRDGPSVIQIKTSDELIHFTTTRSHFSHIAHQGSTDDRAQLRRLTFHSDQALLDVRREAIRAWLQVDAIEAVDAALWTLQQTDKHDALCASIIMRHGSHAQCLELSNLLLTLDRPGLRYRAGRGLRRQPAVADQLLDHFGASRALATQHIYAVLAGWQGIRFQADLQARVLAGGHSPVLRKTLDQALTCIRDLETLAGHVQALHDALGVQRLSALRACLAMEHPFVLAERDDALYIGHALRLHPMPFRKYAFDALQAACERWKPLG